MVFKVVRGNPTAEELAAALAVVRSRTSQAAENRSGPLRIWADPARVGDWHVPRAGRGAWRSTFWPH